MSEQAHDMEHNPTPMETHETEDTHEGNMHVEKWEGIWLRLSVVMVVIFVVNG